MQAAAANGNHRDQRGGRVEPERPARNGPGLSVQALGSGIGMASVDAVQNSIEVLFDRPCSSDEMNLTLWQCTVLRLSLYTLRG
jgi:hypothetical protein